MIEITSFHQGAILNRHHGQESADFLAVNVEGFCDCEGPVTVNGVPARRIGRKFSAPVKLTQKINTVSASVQTEAGEYSQCVQWVWDKNSFPRTNFYIDDHSFFWTDLAKERPRSAFDHFYLKELKKIHDKWGLKVTLNCFYHNDHFDCSIDQVPDVWKQEFIDNSDWLKFSFHSKGEFPDRPYIEAGAAEFQRDFDQLKEQLVRIFGEETFTMPVVIHWAMISPSAARFLLSRGLKAYSCGAFRPQLMGGPSAEERAAGNKNSNITRSQQSAVCSAEDAIAQFGVGYDLHFNTRLRNSLINRYGAVYDPYFGIPFFSGICCCNLVPLEQIPGRIESRWEEGLAAGRDIYNLASHEQYTFPYYHNYIPDHLQRIEGAIKGLVERGCKPVFFNDGFMGNESWGK